MKRFFIILCLLSLCAALAAFVMPRSLARRLDDCSQVMLTVGGGFSDTEQKELTLTFNMAGFAALKGLLAPYTYHPTLATLVKNTTITGTTDYDIVMYVFDADGQQTFYFHSLGKQKTWINDTTYHIGYFGDKTAQKLAEALTDFVELYN